MSKFNQILFLIFKEREAISQNNIVNVNIYASDKIKLINEIKSEELSKKELSYLLTRGGLISYSCSCFYFKF